MPRLFLILLVFLGSACEPSSVQKTKVVTQKTSPPAPPPKPKAPESVFYSGTMSISDSKLYAQFLENARFPYCRNSGCIGQCDCDNWLGEPTVELAFSPNLKTLKSFTFYPQGSGSWYVGNRGAGGFPVVIPAQAPVRPVNEDEGWAVSISVNNVTSLILYCEDCDLKKGEMDDLQAFRGSRNYEIGELSVSKGALKFEPAAPNLPY